MNYDWPERFKSVWESAVLRYRIGCRKSEELLDERELEFLQSMGQNAQELYDYAEDFVRYGEPSIETVIAVTQIRLTYFREIQKEQPSEQILDPETLPAKTDEVEGISWLPRLLLKAKAKLRGELHPDIMYGCGGDRNFFKHQDIHPAEFLVKVADNMENDQAVVDWVKSKKES